MIKLECMMGNTLVADGAVLRISSKKSETTIPIRSIVSFEIKEPGIFSNGSIKISVAKQNSGYLAFGGAIAGFGSELMLVYDPYYNNTALEIRKYVEEFDSAETKHPFSVSDELFKLKELMDQGVLTRDEFEIEKKKLLAK